MLYVAGIIFVRGISVSVCLSVCLSAQELENYRSDVNATHLVLW